MSMYTERVGRFPTDADMVGLLPELNLAHLKPGQIMEMQTSTGDVYRFTPVQHPTVYCVHGILCLPSSVAGDTGLPMRIGEVQIHGASNSKALISMRLKPGIGAEMDLPLRQIGPELSQEDDMTWKLRFNTLPLVRAEVVKDRMIPPQQERFSAGSFSSPVPVDRWPGIDRGVSFDVLRRTLYGAPILSLRGRYFIHPQTGRITKFGRTVERVDTVWDIVDTYLRDYKNRQDQFLLHRIAAFYWWACSLGLSVPASTANLLCETGLE